MGDEEGSMEMKRGDKRCVVLHVTIMSQLSLRASLWNLCNNFHKCQPRYTPISI